MAEEQQDESEQRRARAEATLATEFHRIFNLLVDVSAKIHTGEVAVDYEVLADLIRAPDGER